MAMLPGRWRRRRDHDLRHTAGTLYRCIVERARDPVFYQEYRVPDTLDGRFDVLVMQAYLVMRRLRAAGEPGERLAQVTFDVMIEDLDRNLREIGVGDLSVGKKVKVMARAFYGRVAAYEAGLADAADDGSLVEALRRNVYRGETDTPAEALARHVRALAGEIDALPAEALLAGRLDASPVAVAATVAATEGAA
ncbi:MAG: ubiquinol-cytochrome C chaperone family protein [Rhodospirillaceae bacterium]|nr:ubiquinol-cytochrome C chaperone family protein [Rhodospirillaceae bacterium]